MKIVFMIALFAATNIDLQAFDTNSTTGSLLVGQLCGDGCDGTCKPERPETV